MKNILLIGAGSAGKKVVKELKSNNECKIIGFLDKDKSKFGSIVEDIIVLGDYENIENFVKNMKIDEILLTSTLISSDEIRIIKEKLKDFSVHIEQIPEIEELNRDEEFLPQLKEVNIPLSVPNLDKIEILKNLKECLESGWVSTGGRFITEFENKVSKYVNVSEAVGVQSGTGGLHVALRVLGVQKGEEVFSPTLTFIAAVNPIVYQGAEPIFIDCDETLCIDPFKIEKFCKENCEMRDELLYNKKTGKIIRVLIVVHVFGNMANMEKIMEVAKKYNLKVLEDATEALGSYYIKGKYKNKYAGTIGDMGVYSFNANKIITTGGGGMVVSNNKNLLEKVRFLTTQAKTNQLYFTHDEIGYNYRMLNIQAALGTSQIDNLKKFIETKEKNYKKYKEEIDKIDGLYLMTFDSNIQANYWFYSVVVDEKKYGINKDQLLRKLVDSSIQTRPIWGLIHQQKPYINHETYGIEKSLWYHDRILNIPCSSNLAEEDVEIVIQKLKEFKK